MLEASSTFVGTKQSYTKCVTSSSDTQSGSGVHEAGCTLGLWTLLSIYLMMLDYGVCRKVEPTADTVIVQYVLSQLHATFMMLGCVTCQQHASFLSQGTQFLNCDPFTSTAGPKQHRGDRHIACEELVQLSYLLWF